MSARRDGGPSCAPGAPVCEGDRFGRCDAEGAAVVWERTCDRAAGERCFEGGCADLCAAAAASKSYVGCEYWAVPTMNDPSLLPDPTADPPWPGFDFALVVANTGLVEAAVTVEPAVSAAPVVVAPGAVEVVTLPWVDALQQDRSRPLSAQWHSRFAPDGAYRVRADVPVTVYQFNPLDYAKNLPGGRIAYSYTNDASLLLPTHVLTGEYRVVAMPTRLLERPGPRDTPEDPLVPVRGLAPGFAAVVAVAEGTTELEVRAAGHVAASEDGRMPALAPGERATVTLAQGEVLQLLSGAPPDCPGAAWTPEPGDASGLTRYCDVGPAWDLTGSELRATRPIAVIAGHQCAFVPHHRWACDHLEESQFPVQTWGKEVLVPAPDPVRGEPFVARVLSATDGNAIRFDPPVAPPVTLDAGGAVTFEVDTDFVVLSEDPVAVAQFLVGQDYFRLGGAGDRGAGDPSMSFGIPREQLRDRYAFLSPPRFAQSWITVLAPAEATVTLDGRPLARETGRLVGATGLVASRHQVVTGAHRLEADRLVGLVVYGYADYTSYMVPGGLDFVDLGILR